MKEVTKAIFDRLNGDATLTGGLAAYPAAAGTKAIFSRRPVPPDAVPPWVVIQEVSGIPFDTKTSRGRDLLYDVSVFADATGSIVTVEDLVERCRTLLHRHLLSVAGWTTIIADVTGPVEAPTDETLYGRTISLRLVLTQ